VEYLGGLNIQNFCNAKYPGSRAVVVNNGWYALDAAGTGGDMRLDD
jgi:hypothetical protein